MIMCCERLSGQYCFLAFGEDIPCIAKGSWICLSDSVVVDQGRRSGGQFTFSASYDMKKSHQRRKRLKYRFDPLLI